MTTQFSTGLKNAILGKHGLDDGTDGVRGLLNGGILLFYTGAMPSTPDYPAQAELIAVASLNGGPTNGIDRSATLEVLTNGLTFSSPSNATLSKSPAEIWQATPIIDGFAVWFRFRASAADDGLTSTTAIRMDGLIGTGADRLDINPTFELGFPKIIETFNINL